MLSKAHWDIRAVVVVTVLVLVVSPGDHHPEGIIIGGVSDVGMEGVYGEGVGWQAYSILPRGLKGKCVVLILTRTAVTGRVSVDAVYANFVICHRC